MNELAFSIGGIIVLLVLGAIRQIRLQLGLVDYDRADIEELKERLTRTEERLESEKKTNALLHKMIDEQAKDLKRFEERWADAWNRLQSKGDKLLETREELHTARTENVLLKAELTNLKEQLAGFDKRLTELRMQREEVAEQAEENKRLAILNQGRFQAIPDILSQLGLDSVIQDWARAAFKATEVPDNGPEPDGVDKETKHKVDTTEVSDGKENQESTGKLSGSGGVPAAGPAKPDTKRND